MLLALDVEVPGRDPNRQGGGKQEDCFEEQGKPIDPHHSVKAVNREKFFQGAKIKSASHRDELRS